jgi:hypothetical protein
MTTSHILQYICAAKGIRGQGRFQHLIFMPNWICRAPEVPSARLTSEVEPKGTGIGRAIARLVELNAVK